MNTNKGFTLIELLVVVSTVVLLSSIVLTSISSARAKAKDTAIKEGASQLSTLMNLNYNEYGNYCNLQSGWIGSGGCTTLNNGNYGTRAQEICTNIFNNSTSDFGSVNRIYANTSVGCNTVYSFMIATNTGQWFCTGSSGRKGTYASYSGQPGCWDNP